MNVVELDHVKSVHIIEENGKTYVYILGVDGLWNGVFETCTVMMSREGGKFVGIVRHAQSMSVYDVKRIEVNQCGDVMVWV